MRGRTCYHCKQWVEEGETHDCWTTTESALTQDLADDLRDAWERLRETAASFGDQRIYASHKSIMFSRKSCYFFVRPKRQFLEVCVFLGRTVKAPQVRHVDRASKSKVVHVLHVRHRDEVEAPIADWLREAYDLSDTLAGPGASARSPHKKSLSGNAASGRRRNADGTKRRRMRAAAPSHPVCPSSSSWRRRAAISQRPGRRSSDPGCWGRSARTARTCP